MKPKFTLLVAITFILLFCATLDSKAQRSATPKSRKSLYLSSRGLTKLSFTAAAGMSTINSDNRWQGYNGNIGLLRANGVGLNGGLGMMYQFSPFVGIMGNMQYFRLKGHEDEGNQRLEQSVSFITNGFTASSSLVVNLANREAIIGLNRRSIRNRLIMVPYLKAGLGLMSYSASSKTDRQGLTDGDLSASAIIFPVGGGLRFRCSDQFSIAPEFTVNLTSTDNIETKVEDGGYTGNSDHLFTTTVKLFYTPAPNKRRRSF